jgi:hypothetical protein
MKYMNIKSQRGQSMVEYVVVVFFSVLLLAAPLYDPGDPDADDTFKNFDYATGQGGKRLNAVQAAEAVIKDNYRGYSYAMSLSEYPDYLPLQEQQQALNDINDQLNDLNDLKDDAADFVDNNLPPSLPSYSFPVDIPPDFSSISPF